MQTHTLTTTEFAKLINRSRDHVRKKALKNGHYLGVYPLKQADGHWYWPADAVGHLREAALDGTLNTADFASAVGFSIAHVRQSLSEKGHFHGAVPQRRVSGQLAWSPVEVVRLRLGIPPGCVEPPSAETFQRLDHFCSATMTRPSQPLTERFKEENVAAASLLNQAIVLQPSAGRGGKRLVILAAAVLDAPALKEAGWRIAGIPASANPFAPGAGTAVLLAPPGRERVLANRMKLLTANLRHYQADSPAWPDGAA